MQPEVNIKQYEDDFLYTDDELGEHGTVTLTVGMELCFFVWNSHTETVRQQLRQCIDQYMQYFGEHITWGYNPDSWKRRHINDVIELDELLNENNEPDDIIEYYIASGDKDISDDANQYNVFCMTVRGWETQHAAMLRLRVPYAYYYDKTQRKQLLTLYKDCYTRLTPYYATMGWVCAHGYDDDKLSIDMFDTAQLFFGLAFGMIDETSKIRQGIRDFGWQTYVSHDLAERIGGVRVLQSQLTDQRISYIHAEYGTNIQVTPYPDLMPKDKPIPSSVTALNHILRPMRNGNFGSMGDGYDAGVGFQSFSKYFTDLWMRRFDNPKQWRTLPQPKTLPVFSVPDNVTLQSDDVCEISGRYHYEDEYDYIRGNSVYFDDNGNDYRQHVVLLKGDKAPFYIMMDQYGNFKESVKIAWTLIEVFEKVNTDSN